MGGANRRVLLLNPHMKQIIETLLWSKLFRVDRYRQRSVNARAAFKFGWYRVRPFRPRIRGWNGLFCTFKRGYTTERSRRNGQC